MYNGCVQKIRSSYLLPHWLQTGIWYSIRDALVCCNHSRAHKKQFSTISCVSFLGSSQTQSPAQQYNSPGAVDFKSPPFHRSNTWHGDNLSSSESQYRQRGYEGQRNYGDSGQYNRSPSSSPRHVASSHSGWFGDSNSPEQGAQRSTRDSYDNQRQRILQSQNTMIDAHRQQQSSYRHQPYSSAERRPWNQQQSQTQQQYWRRHWNDQGEKLILKNIYQASIMIFIRKNIDVKRPWSFFLYLWPVETDSSTYWFAGEFYRDHEKIRCIFLSKGGETQETCDFYQHNFNNRMCIGGGWMERLYYRIQLMTGLGSEIFFN